MMGAPLRATFLTGLAMWRGWPTPLMPGDGAPGARHAQTVLRTVCVRALSPAQAAPGLLLYFAASATRTTSLGNALAAPSLREGSDGDSRHCLSHPHCGVRIRRTGCMAERIKGGGMGGAHDGGHERSRAPCLPDPVSPHPTPTISSPSQHGATWIGSAVALAAAPWSALLTKEVSR